MPSTRENPGPAVLWTSEWSRQHQMLGLTAPCAALRKVFGPPPARSYLKGANSYGPALPRLMLLCSDATKTCPRLTAGRE